MRTLLISLALLATLTVTHAKVGRQAILQSGDGPIIIALGDIPTPEAYQTAIDDYMVFVRARLETVVTDLKALSVALENNDLNRAQKAYLSAHYAYETIRPIILVFGNMDRMINSPASAYLLQENDPNFKGFHAVEYALFHQHDVHDALRENQRLLKYLRDLVKRAEIETLFLPKLVQSAPDFAEHILENKLSGRDHYYSGADLSEINANLEGITAILTVLKPHLDDAFVASVEENIHAIRQQLLPYDQAGTYLPLDQLTQTDRQHLYGLTSQLAETLAQLRGLLAIEVYHSFDSKEMP
ncbi:EfeM/EfeO family lipoprotein [Wohlfahrtiimonas chitiniclastica]|uniref:EfeM/EfeO family lipoprotein n=1 Tax=Wohlfahrtiimonas chitiniclastica TaxID=400946 RepID=A0AB35BZP9_9GAMM|nr:EfeM/EfeO family lipoprotein [Wohlfahrtiimonas chitiniclastica]MBS7839598.1 EfeM/EfeO family lipoprotein [Wohlfahrtiimonas chitiniclastica]